ncbi:helix-turn-helix transcriptional regulator [Jatrophihabitans sp. YIM 134969]
MNRTNRLYALVEELRAVAPRPRTSSWLARRFEVSTRTIERDLIGLRDAGVPIWSEPGRGGGYALDPAHTLPPLALTAAEALALSAALRSVASSPFRDDARSAAHKVLAGLPADVRRREEQLAEHVHVVPGDAAATAHEQAIRDAVAQHRVVRLTYRGRSGAETGRDVEPLGLLWADPSWYLVGWCRLRGGLRGFRLDRVLAADLLDEHPAPRDDAVLRRELARLDARPLGAM